MFLTCALHGSPFDLSRRVAKEGLAPHFLRRRRWAPSFAPHLRRRLGGEA